PPTPSPHTNLPLHDALPIYGDEQEDPRNNREDFEDVSGEGVLVGDERNFRLHAEDEYERACLEQTDVFVGQRRHYQSEGLGEDEDRKSTRLNSSHEWISYAV